jgi:hypothetical protein
MIDWINLGTNALWILGCILILATVSYASWQSAIKKEKFLQLLKQPPILFTLNLGGVFFCLGLAATSDTWVRAIVWIFLALAFTAQGIRLLRSL